MSEIELSASVSEGPEQTRWSVVTALGLATLVIASELTMGAFTLAGASEAFNVSSAATAWIVSAYTLPLVAVGIPAGRWLDRADAGLVYLLALVAVAITSIWSAAAGSFPSLIASRIALGTAAAFFLGIYMPIVAATVRENQHGLAIGVIGTIMMLGGVGLAPLGAWAAEALGWRWVFLVKLPILVVALLMGWWTIPRKRFDKNTGERRLPPLGKAFFNDILWLGLAGFALLKGLDLLVNEPFWGAACLLATIVFSVIWTRFDSAKAPLSLLSRPGFGLPALALTLIAAIIGLAAFSFPFYITDVLKESQQLLAMAVVGFVIASALAAPISGLLADRLGPVKMSAIGAAITVMGILTLLLLDAESQRWDLIWCAVAAGFGMGAFNTAIMTTLLNAAGEKERGAASGLAGVSRMLGSTVGPAVAAMAWSLMGGGVAGLHAGAIALAALAFGGLLALLWALRLQARV